MRHFVLHKLSATDKALTLSTDVGSYSVYSENEYNSINYMSADLMRDILCSKSRKNWRKYENVTKNDRSSAADAAVHLQCL